MAEVAEAKTPVCHPVYQTGFHTDEREFGGSRVNSESRGNSIEDDLLFPLLPPSSLSYLLSPSDTAVHLGTLVLKSDICGLATR